MIVVIGSMVLACAFAVRGAWKYWEDLAQLFVPIFILPSTVTIYTTHTSIQTREYVSNYGA